MIDLKRGCYTATKPCGCVEVGDIVQPGQPSNSRLVQTCQQHLKQAQIAALRQRLGDIAAGAYGFKVNTIVGAHQKNKHGYHQMLNAVTSVFGVDRGQVNEYGESLDPLAAWLWERGCRA